MAFPGRVHSGSRLRRVDGVFTAARVRTDKAQQVRDRLDSRPFGLGGMDPEQPLQLGDQLETVGLPVHLEVPAEADGVAKVRARPKRDLFQEGVSNDSGIGVGQGASTRLATAGR